MPIETLTISTHGRGLNDFTSEVAAIVRRAKTKNGGAHLFLQHTSASLIIQENADPDVRTDLIDYFDRIAPEDGPYRHIAEGADDMPAHIKTALTSNSLTIPFADGKLLLGAWQGIYLFEHRRSPQRRRVVVTLYPALSL